ncbi:MAG: M56 family metallopeptidase [Candidatus Angelobacter sp.]
MILSANLHWIASVAAERMFFSLGIGTLLAVIVWLLLRIFPRRDSRTSFAVWFATLLITAMLPLVGLFARNTGQAGGTQDAAITISTSWAVYIFLAWAGIAAAGLTRVAFAIWQVRRLRSTSEPVDWQGLDPELKSLIEKFRRTRPLSLLVSQRLTVPTAIGFFKPAVVLPKWLLEETPADELKYVVLHELAHLRRRDDWTNLAQQALKAVFFFVPSVWWIERRLSLEREMACDDAVLAHSGGTPRGYAECLAHVAERSFLRRQIALAQAAVSRVRQLTVRVGRILDPHRQQPTPLWKPAIPVVVAVAGLCAFSASQGPALISFADNTRANAALWEQPLVAGPANPPHVRAWDAALKSSETPMPIRKHTARKRSSVTDAARVKVASFKKSDRPQMTLAGLQPPQQSPEYVTVREEFVMVVTQRQGSAMQESWQMHVVQFIMGPAKRPEKQVPRKI